MNILVSPLTGGSFYFRSDSTLIRSLTDFYIPDYVEGVSAVPILCFRSERSGKAVREQFVPRYLGPFSCGILLQAALSENNVHEADRIFVQNALDYSTVIPYDLIPVDKYSDCISTVKPFVIKVNGMELSRIEQCPGMEELCRRFSAVSRYCSVRTGDMIAFELAPAIPVCRNGHLTAQFGTAGNISIIVR